mmetsp:Transcript_28867/g.48720  ORF Transcript_28867/g.48720 Transcript_28867/m.48720 type:complete len:95 (+) Transcript_28867:384-668(+)
MAIPKKRLQKEYEKMIAENLSDFSVEIVEPHRWLVTFEMPAASVYPGETHRLEFTFCDNYPIESPQVTRPLHCLRFLPFLVSLCSACEFTCTAR